MPFTARSLFFDTDAAQSYANRVTDTAPIAYWKLNEVSGASIVDSSGNAYNGTYSNVTLNSTPSPTAEASPLCVPASNSYGNLYSAGLAGAFDFDEGCMLIWAKVRVASVWTDSTARRLLLIRRDASNLHYFARGTTNNRITLFHTAGGVTNSYLHDSFSPTGWFSLMMSWSLAGDTINYYVNGVEVGTDSGNVAATGSGLDNTLSLLGAATTSTLHWDGYLSQVIVWNTPASAAMIALGTI